MVDLGLYHRRGGKKERAESEALKLAGTTHKWDSMLAAMDDGLGIPMQQRQSERVE